MEYMFDREITLDSLQKIKAMLDLITERASVVETPNDFLCSPGGMLRLDAICMNLIALGETVKGLDKLTDGQLLKNYPDVYWKGVMGMRDKILRQGVFHGSESEGYGCRSLCCHRNANLTRNFVEFRKVTRGVSY